MKKFYFLAVFLFSCSKVELVDYEFDDYGYFPLQVGNHWTYINTLIPYDTLEIKITGLERINNKVYYKFNNFHFINKEGELHKKKCFIRKINDNVYIHDGNSEEKRYIFNVSLHYQWENNNIMYEFIRDDGKINSASFNYSGCLIYQCKRERAQICDWFSDGVGIVMIFYDRGILGICREYLLHKAIINGEKFGKSEMEKTKKHSMLVRKSIFSP